MRRAESYESARVSARKCDCRYWLARIVSFLLRSSHWRDATSGQCAKTWHVDGRAIALTDLLRAIARANGRTAGLTITAASL